ncbi:dehydrogenase/reductase SDR family member 11 isoform X2 [Lingula anatina]|uniref:Dehydrogenase/reductase SDR family member 11 isoform X2 n=1 Tax=Lingula anatina TaxID=7574 RepID=A0A1S3HIE8_LINAN|nr:dehydrogenase/reductase SDR family member 11 isoform X2 [Lingula anatina]|eukprot:XP_013385782.1 dehydrogenase/reductase SDR family member 11 isoform X2 [Lingula anatina]
MDRWKGRVALVTGASVGIGAAIVRKLVQHGMKVVGCARGVEKIQALADELKDKDGTLLPIKCDLSNEEEILSMFKTIKQTWGGVDVCINNAGLALNAPLLSGATEQWKTMLDVNIMGLCICSREAFKSMRERKVDDGHIILISSMSGHRVIPSAAIHFYSATKYAVTGILEGLRNEVRALKTNIRISAVSPGVVETEFAYRLHEGQEEKAKAIYSKAPVLQGEDIADAVIYALSAPPHVQVHDILLRPTSQVS